MKVLQFGQQNWADQYQIPKEIDWEFNAYPVKEKKKRKKRHNYDAVIFTGEPELTAKEWSKLQWLVDPYKVFYLPVAAENAGKNFQTYLHLQRAVKIGQAPQDLIDDLIPKYFTGQSGIRMPISQLIIDSRHFPAYAFNDGQHLEVDVNSPENWVNLGTYRQSLYIDPNHLIDTWLEYQGEDCEVRLRIYIQPIGGDGDAKDCHYLLMDSDQEQRLPIDADPQPRTACIGVEVRGAGHLRLGVLHSRWSRGGKGEFLTGGQRIVDSQRREDVAYYFNPGDLRPPLNVYFSGARGLEGFEAYPLFRYQHAPSLLFTDMRLEIGQFYSGKAMEKKIMAVIREKLNELGFTNHDLIMNGISMGTYPAMKLGCQLSAYAINVAKPIANLGHVAARGRLQRPGQFDTVFDVDAQIADGLDHASLQKLDREFWDLVKQTDLTQTRLFISYMKNDDYDNRAIKGLKASPAVKKAKQFVYKGFPGRHNDAPVSVQWFAHRVSYLTNEVFTRGNAFNE